MSLHQPHQPGGHHLVKTQLRWPLHGSACTCSNNISYSPNRSPLCNQRGLFEMKLHLRHLPSILSALFTEFRVKRKMLKRTFSGFAWPKFLLLLQPNFSHPRGTDIGPHRPVYHSFTQVRGFTYNVLFSTCQHSFNPTGRSKHPILGRIPLLFWLDRITYHYPPRVYFIFTVTLFG